MIKRDRNAQNLVGLGDCHFWGKGTPVNVVQAFHYYQEARDKNPKYVDVWDRLRLCYLKGMGAPNSHKLAKEAYDRWLALRNASMTQRSRITRAAASSSANEAQITQESSHLEKKPKTVLENLMNNLVLNPVADAAVAEGQTFLPQRNHSVLVDKQIESNKKYLSELDQKIKDITEENERLMRKVIKRERQLRDESEKVNSTAKI
ncbi:MAG: sel1 repeat family protein [Proteobacteria bacterium]|nr:sel1 repeat family protein [Pseudomonadota bacterium]